jgi:Beta-glucosidase (SUN family)
MRSRTFTTGASALLLFATSIVEAKHSHGHLDAIYKRHHAHREQHRSAHEAGESGIALRSAEKGDGNGGQCRFPDDAGLVAVTPHEQNAGWAMSPDQPCMPDSYCPYACPPGQVMMQWDPTATSYSYPKSMVSSVFLLRLKQLTSRRMVVYIAIKTERLRNPFPINHIARMRRPELVH